MDRPNILLIVTDQQRADTIAALGNPIIRTPNLDRLCREGVAFTNAFTPSPVCMPARISLAHGLYPERTGFYENVCADPRPHVHEKETFLHGLTRAGYRTHSVGKWHFYPDPKALRGFESREYEEGDMWEKDDGYMEFLKTISGYEEIDAPYGQGNSMYYIPQPSTVSEKSHSTNYLGNLACDFINGEGCKSSSSGKPWMLYVGFLHPHPPFTPPFPWHKLYKMADMPLPFMSEGAPSLQTFVNQAQNRYKGRDRGTDLNLARMIKAYYYACISFIDHQVGKMLESLESSEQLDDTLIIFMSDHGELLGDFGCWGKRSMHDACARIPFLLRGPGFTGGKICDAPVSLVDIAPTLLNVGSGKIVSHECEGEDLAGLLGGRSKREGVFSRHAYTWWVNLIKSELTKRYPEEAYLEELAATSTHMYVTREWKYIYSAPDDKEFLFDRLGDPAEANNLAENPLNKSILQTMRRVLWNRLAAEGQSEWTLDGNSWRKYPAMEMPSNPDAGIIEQGQRTTPWTITKFPDGY